MRYIDKLREICRNLNDKGIQWKIIYGYLAILVLYSLVFHEEDFSEKILQYGVALVEGVFLYWVVYVVSSINIKLAFFLKKHYGIFCRILSILCVAGSILFAISYFVDGFSRMPFTMLAISISFYNVSFKAIDESKE